MKIATAAALAAAIGSAPPVHAQSPDPAVGADIAETLCKNCHVIGDDPKAKHPNPAAPSFVDIAKMPSTTELSLKVFLRSSHKQMPNILLSADEIDSLAAYILGLAHK